MATASARKPTGGRVSIPLWVVVAVLVIVAGLAGFAIASNSKTSDADLLARAMTGDQEASRQLEERVSLSLEETRYQAYSEAGFTPGTYGEPRIGSRDGGEIVASVFLLLTQGKIEEAMAASNNSSSEELRENAESFRSLYLFLKGPPDGFEEVTVLAELYDPASPGEPLLTVDGSGPFYANVEVQGVRADVLFIVARDTSRGWYVKEIFS